MFLIDYINRLANRLNLNVGTVDENGVSVKQRLTDKINETYKEISNSYNWVPLKRTSEIETISNYTTGTCSITKYDGTNEIASRTVTFSGSTLTSNMQGRYFQPSIGSNWYKIAYVDTSASTIFLLSPMLESTASGISFKIWKRFYYLHSEVRKVIDFGSWIKSGVLQDKTTRQIEDITSNISNVGQPDFFSMYGVDPYEKSYSAGTAKIAKDDNLLVGTGTSWLSNVEPGDIVTISSSIFRVKRVETDIRIILLNFSPVDFPNSISYTITKENTLGFQFYPSPNGAYIFPLTYYKSVYDLVHETKDKTEFPEKFDLAILDGAEAGMMRDLKRSEWINKTREYRLRIVDLKNTGHVNLPRYRTFSPFIPTRRGY